MPALCADPSIGKNGIIATQVIFKTTATNVDDGKIQANCGKLVEKMLEDEHGLQFSSTARAFQTGSSFKDFVVEVLRCLDENNGKTPTKDKPLILLTDGHKSRFGIEAMEYCMANNVVVYLLPPHARYVMTSLLLLLLSLLLCCHCVRMPLCPAPSCPTTDSNAWFGLRAAPLHTSSCTQALGTNPWTSCLQIFIGRTPTC